MVADGGHLPVLLEEALEALQITPGGIYLDGTFGRGGHSGAILSRLGDEGRLLAMDRDPQAVDVAHQRFAGDRRFCIVQGNFSMFANEVIQRGWEGSVNGVLLDLGVSSPQLDESERGFSFMADGPLDMRMDPGSGQTAAEWLSQAGVEEIAQVLREYGDERYARRIARAIVHSQQEEGAITTTGRLAAVVKEAHPRWEPNKHPATRTFQAVRIHINRELEELESFLESAVPLLAPGGRLAIITFHSLEERRVKRFFRDRERGDDFPLDLPIRHSQINSTLRRVGKPIRPNRAEVAGNPRARSSVLRVAERVA